MSAVLPVGQGEPGRESVSVEDLLAKQEIYEVVLRYCRGVDRLDMDLVRSAYHPDGVDHHTGFDGTVQEYLPWLSAALARFAGTMHLVANHLVEMLGDRNTPAGSHSDRLDGTAVAETYGTAVHWGDPADDPRLNFTSGFRYVDRMQRRAGRWAIAERWAVRDWTRSDAGLAIPKEGAGPRGARDHTDPVYRVAELGRAGSGRD